MEPPGAGVPGIGKEWSGLHPRSRFITGREGGSLQRTGRKHGVGEGRAVEMCIYQIRVAGFDDERVGAGS
jgi:hypothetical protein